MNVIYFKDDAPPPVREEMVIRRLDREVHGPRIAWVLVTASQQWKNQIKPNFSDLGRRAKIKFGDGFPPGFYTNPYAKHTPQYIRAMLSQQELYDLNQMRLGLWPRQVADWGIINPND